MGPIAGLFLFSLVLFWLPERELQSKSVVVSAIIAIAVAVLMPLAFLMIALSFQSSTEYTIFHIPLSFFIPIALPAGILTLIVARSWLKNGEKTHRKK